MRRAKLQTTNLGVRSSNLFGRANYSIFIDTTRNETICMASAWQPDRPLRGADRIASNRNVRIEHRVSVSRESRCAAGGRESKRAIKNLAEESKLLRTPTNRQELPQALQTRVQVVTRGLIRTEEVREL